MLAGSKHSEATKKKLREASLRNGNVPPSQRGISRTVSMETREKIRKSLLGRKHTIERRLRQSRAKLGKKMSKEFCQKISQRNKINGIKPPTLCGEAHPNWKGDKAGYVSLHMWVKNNLGTPKHCEHCGFFSESNRKIHWANKSHEYKRNLTDWIRLCVPCHSKYDRVIKT